MVQRRREEAVLGADWRSRGGAASPHPSHVRPRFVSVSVEDASPKSTMVTLGPAGGVQWGNLLKNKSLRLFTNKGVVDKL